MTKRLLIVAALVTSATAYAAPASAALTCPFGTQPRALPTGHTVCVPERRCDPMACPQIVRCPTDVPVWSGTCRMIFGG